MNFIYKFFRYTQMLFSVIIISLTIISIYDKHNIVYTLYDNTNQKINIFNHHIDLFILFMILVLMFNNIYLNYYEEYFEKIYLLFEVYKTIEEKIYLT